MDPRSQHLHDALAALTFPRERPGFRLPSPAPRDHPPHSAQLAPNDNPAIGLPHSAGVDVAFGDASSPRPASRHPHRSMRFLMATNPSDWQAPPPPPPPPPPPANGGADRDIDTESQSDTIIDRGPSAGFRRMSKLILDRLTFWQRLRGDGKPRIGWFTSLKRMATFTWLNAFLFLVPVAFIVEHTRASRILKFLLSFFAIMPLSKLLDYGSEQLSLYCGKSFGDLLIITLNNAVETILAIVLLTKCELELLQSTIAGVVLLRLLLVPGASFIMGGVNVLSQELHPHVAPLNNTLLILGVLTMTIPMSFFSTLDRVLGPATQRTEAVLSDKVRGHILEISRGLAALLIVTYICSRIYLHNPPGQVEIMIEDGPDALKQEDAGAEHHEPEVNPWACIFVLIVAVVLLAITAEHLVINVHGVEVKYNLTHEWFGLILLPLVSYSADGMLCIVYCVHSFFRPGKSSPSGMSSTLAQGRSIDLAIQFLTFWLPFIVVVGWIASKPVSLLFNLFEIVVMLGACFIVSFVTVDSKTNWVEGFTMVAFYVIITIAAWFYPGQADVRVLQSCLSVPDALAKEQQAFVALKDMMGTSKPPYILPATGAVNANGTSLPTAEAINTLNQRLQEILDLHSVLTQSSA